MPLRRCYAPTTPISPPSTPAISRRSTPSCAIPRPRRRRAGPPFRRLSDRSVRIAQGEAMAHDGRLGARGRRRFAHQGARGAEIRPPRQGGPFAHRNGLGLLRVHQNPGRLEDVRDLRRRPPGLTGLAISVGRQPESSTQPLDRGRTEPRRSDWEVGRSVALVRTPVTARRRIAPRRSCRPSPGRGRPRRR